MSRFAPCDNCSGEVVVGVFNPITVVLQDEEGFPVLDENGIALRTTFRLPGHRAAVPHSTFDPTGLAPAACPHGLAEHPDPERQAEGRRRGAVSWIRDKYLDITRQDAKCPVCKGEPAPADLATPRT